MIVSFMLLTHARGLVYSPATCPSGEVIWTIRRNNGWGQSGTFTITLPEGVGFDNFDDCVWDTSAEYDAFYSQDDQCSSTYNLQVRVLRRTDTNQIIWRGSCCNTVDFIVSASGACAAVTAVGDPHLQNIYGQRFDLMRPGKVVLVHIPRGKPVERALLVVEADAVRLGGQCADMYFQKVNVTGAWADKAHAGGLRFDANLARDEHPKWVKLGPVELKVAHGRTNTGILYLNFYIKHLKFAGFDIGGVLGADDHTAEETPTEDCQKQLAVFSKSWPKSVNKSVASATLG